MASESSDSGNQVDSPNTMVVTRKTPTTGERLATDMPLDRATRQHKRCYQRPGGRRRTQQPEANGSHTENVPRVDW